MVGTLLQVRIRTLGGSVVLDNWHPRLLGVGTPNFTELLRIFSELLPWNLYVNIALLYFFFFSFFFVISFTHLSVLCSTPIFVIALLYILTIVLYQLELFFTGMSLPVYACPHNLQQHGPYRSTRVVSHQRIPQPAPTPTLMRVTGFLHWQVLG